jgi:hypothetical protein
MMRRSAFISDYHFLPLALWASMARGLRFMGDESE